MIGLFLSHAGIFASENSNEQWFLLIFQKSIGGPVMFRAYLRAFVFWVSFKKKEKEDKKSPFNGNSIYLVFYHHFLSKGCRWSSFPTLSASHSFLDFGEAVRFHPFFASYFVLHNSYSKILTIHRYKSSWRCLQSNRIHRDVPRAK